MINDLIAYGIADNLTKGDIITRATGCIRYTPVKDGFDVTNPVLFKSATGGQSTCQTDAKLFSFLPNSDEKGIVFFEDHGATGDDFGSQYTRWKGKLKMFVWLNTKLIDPSNPIGIKRKIADMTIDDIEAEADVVSGSVRISKIYGTDEKPYKKCNLDEKNKQYLTHPFDYMVLDLDVVLITVKGCLPTLEQNPEIC